MQIHFGWFASALTTSLALLSFQALAGDSQCFGTVNNGRIEGSVKLPSSGANFSAYSSLAVMAGRTHVHTAVAAAMTAAYSALQSKNSSTTYVYGETGWPSGRLAVWRTH
jgi:penicillin-insensitive murein DD-endopeptidase